MSDTKEVVINVCFGGFSLSDEAYEKLIEWGVPVQKYVDQKRDPKTRLYLDEPANEGEVIFDRELTPKGEDKFNDIYHEFKGRSRMSQRYWETWLDDKRDHPLLIKAVKQLKNKANGACADLKIVKIPADIEYTIEEYDGNEHIAEVHQT